MEISSASENSMEEIRGNALEIQLNFQSETEKTAERYGIKVCCSSDRQEETVIYYDRINHWLGINRDRSTLDPKSKMKSKGGPFTLSKGEGLKLHIFIDHSVIEVIANDRQSITSRIYPTSSNSVEVDPFAQDGSVVIEKMDVWPMSSIGLDFQV